MQKTFVSNYNDKACVERRLLVNDFNKQMVLGEQPERYEIVFPMLKNIGYEIDHTEGENTSKLKELEDYDVCFLTGPTCMMHYVRVPSISIPFTIAESDGLPLSMILYAKNENCLLDFTRVIKELKMYEE